MKSADKKSSTHDMAAPLKSTTSVDAETLQLIREIEATQLELERKKTALLQSQQPSNNVPHNTQAAISQDELFKAILDNNVAPIFSVDTAYCYTSFNKAHAAGMKAIYGADIEIGCNLLDYQTVPEDSAIAKRNLDRAIQGEHFTESAFSGDHKLQRLYFEISHSPIYNGSGKIIGVSVIAKDISTRKHAEEELAQQKYFFEQMFMQSCVSTEILDAEGWCVRINPKLSEIFGVQPEHIEGKLYNILKDEELIQAGIMPILETVFTTKKTVEWEVHYDIGQAAKFQNIEVAEKKKAWYYACAYPIFNQEGTLTNVILQHTDITKRKQIELALEKYAGDLKHSNDDLENFAFIASHDLQEPLRMVSSFLSLLEKRLDDRLTDTTREYMNFAVDGAKRMKLLISDLLHYSRVGTNKEQFTIIDLNEMLLYITQLLKEDIDKNQAVITIHPLPVIKANRILMNELFVNLLGNALKYRGEKDPVIEVGYTEEYDQYNFYVRDNGIGIEADYFDKIFVIFQRLHGKTEYPGTGIGLALCRKIVETHKGKIWVESKLGEGSCFCFSIPKVISI